MQVRGFDIISDLGEEHPNLVLGPAQNIAEQTETERFQAIEEVGTDICPEFLHPRILWPGAAWQLECPVGDVGEGEFGVSNPPFQLWARAGLASHGLRGLDQESLPLHKRAVLSKAAVVAGWD